MAIREPPRPRTLEEFENLSWNQKRQLKEENSDAYWDFIWQIQEREGRRNYWKDTKNVETISDNTVAKKMEVKA